MKKVVVISTSLRPGSNSHALAEQFAKGAEAAGHQVELVSLRGKEIKFCIGCLSCQKTGACVIKDDVPAIMESVLNADVVCWATPIYYYEMSGQMKTLIDRMNAMYPKDYKFRDIYLLTTAAENEEHGCRERRVCAEARRKRPHRLDRLLRQVRAQRPYLLRRRGRPERD